MSEIFRLFPTPVMRVEQLLDAALIEELIGEVTASRTVANTQSGQLTHTEIMQPGTLQSFQRASALIQPKLVEFGTLLFGEELPWAIKEIWTNVLETGGRQSVHTHANSFVSGVLYLTDAHPSANLVFHKSAGGSEFIFSNQHKNVKYGPFNGRKWALPQIGAGDLVLFPSYLLHEVPVNRGERRVSMAFNAVPARLESFGYAINLS